MQTEVDSRQQRRRLRTRALLIDAARRVMSEKGVDATSLRDIASAADLALGTFYNHFDSKDAVVDAIVDQAVERLGEGLDRLSAEMDDPAEVFAVSFRHTLRSVELDPVWGWFVVRVKRAGDKLGSHLGYRASRDLKRGIASGRFARTRLRPFLIAIQGMLESAMLAKLEGRSKRGDDTELTAYTLILLGVDADEARKIAGRPLPEVSDSETAAQTPTRARTRTPRQTPGEPK